jgi:hypothetical protein
VGDGTGAGGQRRISADGNARFPPPGCNIYSFDEVHNSNDCFSTTGIDFLLWDVWAPSWPV